MVQQPMRWLLWVSIAVSCVDSAPKTSDSDGSGADTGVEMHDTSSVGDDTAPDDDTADTGDTGGDDVVPLPAGAIVLDHVRVVDAAGVRVDQAVVIAGDEIWDVVDGGGPWPEGADVRDRSGSSVVPGLIDAHVHLFHSGAPWWVGPSLADNLRAQLAWGVVGVADLGSPEEIFDVRERVASGTLAGPRIWATGPMLTAVGSHPCETVVDSALCRFVDGDGPDVVAGLDRADGLKVVLADAAFSPWPTPRLDLGDLAEIVSAADAAGQPVWVHVDAIEDATDADAAGAEVLAHPVFGGSVPTGADLPARPVLSTHGAFAGTGDLLSGDLLADDLSRTPAAVVDSWAWVAAHPESFAEDWITESADWETIGRASLVAAYGEGLPIVAGSDAGYWFVPHGLGLHRELDALVELGWTPVEALAAATAAPADLLGWHDLGWVAPGYRADLLVVRGAPDEDIRALRDLAELWLGGEIWADGPAWQSADGSGVCVDDRDCGAAESCDGIDQRCHSTCAPTWDVTGVCGVESACLPVDGLLSVDGACHPFEGCDLVAQDCSPAAYGEACVPMDLDTNRCWPAGPRGPGEACDPSVAATRCAQGTFCSSLDQTCYELCDPEGGPSCSAGSCVRQWVAGQPWFGVCL